MGYIEKKKYHSHCTVAHYSVVISCFTRSGGSSRVCIRWHITLNNHKFMQCLHEMAFGITTIFFEEPFRFEEKISDEYNL